MHRWPLSIPIGDILQHFLFTLATEKYFQSFTLISHTEFTITENSADNSFGSNRYDTDYRPLRSKVVVNLSWRGKRLFPVAPSAGNETTKVLGRWRDKVVFTKKTSISSLMLGNCLSPSSKQSFSLLRLFWCMKDSTRVIETARTPTKNESFTLSFNILHYCLRWQAKAIWKEKKKKRKVCCYLLTMLSTFVYPHLLEILFLESILLQEALTKKQPTKKNPTNLKTSEF